MTAATTAETTIAGTAEMIGAVTVMNGKIFLHCSPRRPDSDGTDLAERDFPRLRVRDRVRTPSRPRRLLRGEAEAAVRAVAKAIHGTVKALPAV